MDYLFKDDNFMDASGIDEHKKLFGDCSVDDVDKQSMRLLSDEWTANPDDYLDTIFSLNSDFLSELDELQNMQMDTTPPQWTSPQTLDRTSPLSSVTTESECDFMSTGGSMNLSNEPIMANEQHYVSSSASDSGLSSDNVETDMGNDYDLLGAELLQPSSPVADAEPVYKIQNQYPTISLSTPIKSAPVADLKKIPMIVSKNSVPRVVFETTQSTVNKPMVSIQTGADQKPRIKILKKISTIPAGVTGTSIGQNIAFKLADSTTTMKDSQTGTIVLNKTNGIRKLIQVKKANNQRSILLPVSFKNGTDIRSIKIIKSSNLTKSPKIIMAASNLLQEYKQGTQKGTPAIFQESSPDPYDDSGSDQSDSESYKYDDMILKSESIIRMAESHSDGSEHGMDNQSEYPKLLLSNEEKRLLAKEGIALPGHYPLTKHEERELKRIRRKIRNKISAQDSRKRKKEYVDGLEERVKKCTDENQTLLKRIKMLQQQNHNLMQQMKKMQSLLTKGTSKTAQPATCLMVLLLSMALIAAPNLRLNQTNNGGADVTPKEAIELSNKLMNDHLAQNRRSLLQERFSDSLVDEEMNIDDIPFYNEHDYAEMTAPPASGPASPIEKKPQVLIDFDVDDHVWTPPTSKMATDLKPNNDTKPLSNTAHELLNDCKDLLCDAKNALEQQPPLTNVDLKQMNLIKNEIDDNYHFAPSISI